MIMDKSIQQANKRIPRYFIAFFVILAIVDGIFVTVATSTHRGVVTEQSYKKGLAYNKTVAAAESQEALGWNSHIHYDEDTIRFSLTDHLGNSIQDAQVRAHILRPTQDGYDFSILLTEKQAGHYSNNIQFPMKGQWDIKVTVLWNKQPYQQSKRIIVK